MPPRTGSAAMLPGVLLSPAGGMQILSSHSITSIPNGNR
jgi:hypothetical protein